MVQINFAKREVQCKVVYYGPEFSGKTTNLRQIHDRSPPKVRGTLTSIATDTDRTLFFDFLPLDLGPIGNIRAKINLYAIPYLEGQNALRLLVLEGVDGLVFVADSAPERMHENRDALENLHRNINHLGRDIREIPIVFQWNKRDHPQAVAPEELAADLNPGGAPAFPATAATCQGVLTTLKAITHDVLETIAQLVVAPAVAAAPAPVPHVEELARIAHQSDPALQPLGAQPEPEPVPEALPAAAMLRMEDAPSAARVPVALPAAAMQPMEDVPNAARVPVAACARVRAPDPSGASGSFSSGGSQPAFDEVSLPPEEDLPAAALPDEEPEPSIVPPWRQDPPGGPQLVQGPGQFTFEPSVADSNAVSREFDEIEAALPDPEPELQADVPRAADVGHRPGPRRGFMETETSLIEPAAADAWEDYEAPADEDWEIPEPEPEPLPQGRVRVGGRRVVRAPSHGWDNQRSDVYGGARRRHDARPVIDRRARPRINRNIETLSTATLVTGSLVALAVLIGIGILVHQLL